VWKLYFLQLPQLSFFPTCIATSVISHQLSLRRDHCIDLSILQDGFIHIAASGWISVNTEEKTNKHYIQKVKNQ